jgi:predicted dehydrogenase
MIIANKQIIYDTLTKLNFMLTLLRLYESLHKEWVVKALRADKHVLLEKPVALSAADFTDMLSEAYRNNKFIMDGTMFPHHNRTSDVLQAVLNQDVFGTLNRIQSSFSFLGNDDFFANDIRVQKDGDPLGCIGDLGWYCVRFALLVYGKLGLKVESVQALDFRLTPDSDIPVDATCLVRFEQVSRLFTSMLKPHLLIRSPCSF